MAGRIIYLEVDDEITSAAARIRDAEPMRIAVVLPYGSRVATSRINFRLLGRDALTHEKRLSIISGDAATRALAASAGLPVFSSAAEYESSLVGVDDGPQAEPVAPVVEVVAVAAATVAVESRPAVVSDGTLGLVVPEASVDTIRTSILREPSRTPRDPPPTDDRDPAGPPPLPVSAAATGARDRGGKRTPWLVGGAILALAVLIGGVGAYLLLPSATIVVTPRTEPVGPIESTVIADPAATSVDAAAGVIPASLVTIPVAVDDTFSATGKRVSLTKATGKVRFENLDPTSTNRITSGSIVSTASGVRFRTAVTVTVPKAELVGLQIFPARASVKVTAVEGGPDGNVEAGAIVVVPRGEISLFLKVTNVAATSGGSSEEFTRVTQADVDGALAALNLSLQESFRQAMADPSLSAGGATVFPESGTLAEPIPTVLPGTLVGQEVKTFSLGLSATGTVTTAETAPITSIAETQLRAEVDPNHRLVQGSMEIVVGDGLVIGQTVRFPVTATAEQVAILDPAVLKAKVLGRPVGEAKAILLPYGQVELTVSPDWTGSVPTFDSRVDLTIEQAVAIETPAPSATP